MKAGSPILLPLPHTTTLPARALHPGSGIPPHHWHQLAACEESMLLLVLLAQGGNPLGENLDLALANRETCCAALLQAAMLLLRRG